MLVFLWTYVLCAERTFAQVNLALHMPAYQSSSNHETHAEMANDGNRVQQFYDGTCTHTRRELAPWWTVDLRENYSILSLRIYNRDGECYHSPHLRCADRLIGFRVHVSDEINATIPSTRFKHLCHRDNETRMPLIIDVHCTSPLFGRYVTISLNRTSVEYFTLCEVEVYGLGATNPVSEFTSLPSTSLQRWSSGERTTSETSPDTKNTVRIPDTGNSVSKSLPSILLQQWSSDEGTTSETSQDTTNPVRIPDTENPVSTSLPSILLQQWSSYERTTSETSSGTTNQIRIPNMENPVSTSLPSSTSLQLWSSDGRITFETIVPLYTRSFTTDARDQVSPTSSYVDWVEISATHTKEMTTYDEANFSSHIAEMTSSQLFPDHMISSVTKRKPCCCSLRRPTSVTELNSHEFMSSILKELDIVRKNVTQQRRKYISMPDERKSSLAISVSFLGATLALCGIILCDVKKVLQDLTGST